MNRAIQIFIIGLAVSGIILVGGCESGKNSSPATAVVEAYMLANEGKYFEAEKYLSSEAIAKIQTLAINVSGGVKGVWDRETRGGTIQKVEILKEEVQSEEAKVYFELHFEGGESNKEDASLIKLGEQWKIIKLRI